MEASSIEQGTVPISGVITTGNSEAYRKCSHYISRSWRHPSDHLVQPPSPVILSNVWIQQLVGKLGPPTFTFFCQGQQGYDCHKRRKSTQGSNILQQCGRAHSAEKNGERENVPAEKIQRPLGFQLCITHPLGCHFWYTIIKNKGVRRSTGLDGWRTQRGKNTDLVLVSAIHN